MNNIFRIFALLTIAVFIWYVVADRATPFTFNARVKAVVTPIVPRVAGMVVDVPAVDSTGVEAGALLARIDPRPFELMLERRKAELEAATQDVGASSAEVERAQAELVRAQVNLDNTRTQAARWLELQRKQLASRAQADEARTALSDAEGKVTVAAADLERARQNLGSAGLENPRVRSALADLAAAELDLSFTEIRAPSRGGVVNLSIAVGAQAQPGQSLMTFIDARDVWVEAYFTENNIGRIAVGDPVDVVLDTHPGRVLQGQVESIVSAAYLDDRGADGLPNPQDIDKWLRSPQRFPVRIVLPGYETGDESDDVKLFVNGQADVIVYTGENWVMNTLGALYIKTAALFSYLY